MAFTADTNRSKTTGGLTVKGLAAGDTTERPMHGGPHENHFVAAVFDATSGARVWDAVVTAELADLGLSGTKKKFEPMQIAGTRLTAVSSICPASISTR